MKTFFDKYFELIVWITALVSIGFMDLKNQSFSFCIFKLYGFTWCPGCGLAHAIGYAMHGNLTASFHEHFFGIPALVIIVNRIITLFNTNLIKHKSLYHGF